MGERRPRTATVPLLVGVATALLLPAAADAHSGGEIGHSGKQGAICNQCHSGGTAPTVAFDGPAVVAVGASASYRFTVQSARDRQRAAGFNVAVSGGTLVLIPGEGEQLLGGELTHRAPQDNVDGSASWQFTWTAPAVAGSATLFGAGNSVNRDGRNTGDRASATTLVVTVIDVATPSPSATPLPSPTSTPPPTATPPASPTRTPPPTATPPPSPTSTPPPTATPPASPTRTPPPTATPPPSPTGAPPSTATSPPSPTGAPPSTATSPPSPTGTPPSTVTSAPSPTGTALATATDLLTDTRTPGPTATPAGPCRGDCDGSRAVTVNELVLSVGIALGGSSTAACPAVDGDDDGQVAINELIAAVANLLNGCS